ncbi:U4/U6 small nuclear ribonucleoprotein PRP3 [Plasmodium gonderi]|uniref:U4/U6 small nuclear ribonucleoprotein PRP3 n=1 Tax=Plasmodium gonderi TaxID=77519 RepID=A0A1Y1JLI4_PLAGO|nr:U4/U6 small nuclear ribonucleoprotein PRP3 [Plasmodium gonderi]GAW83301.1 U4/U6 small nuclear ribonucleoprotein PRP3 [Plasmodium gonderi]
MEEVQKKRKSRWGDAEKKADNNEAAKMIELTKAVEQNRTIDTNVFLSKTSNNILENLNLNRAPNLVNPITSLPTQFPTTTQNFAAFSPAIHLSILKATEAAKLAIERAKRASRLEESAKQNLRKVDFIPKPLKFDEQGREIDEEGNVINIKPITYSTLKVNINKLEENNILKKKNDLLNKNNEENLNEDIKWFDSRIKSVRKKKRKNAFNFVTPGSLVKLANSRNYNSKSQMNFDLKKFMQDKKNVQTFQEMSLNFLNNDLNDNVNPNLIDINKKNVTKKEWNEEEKYNMMEKWDLVLFKKIENKENLKEYIDEQKALWQGKLQMDNSTLCHNGTNNSSHADEKIEQNLSVQEDSLTKGEKNNNKDLSEYVSSTCMEVNKLVHKQSENMLLLQSNEIIINDELYKINFKRITNYIEHPVSLNEDKKEEKTTPHMFLTPLERKKLRKRKRQEKEREKQDKIRIGLIPPPPPKMKLSNLMRILGDSAVSNPSRIELEVREQMKERELRHFKQNQQRKLNPEEKSKKKMNKWICDPNEENEVLVIYITNLSNKKHIFKIDINAQQLHLTGVCFMSVLYNFIIVEGKHISIERYKRLIFRRIKWNEDEYDNDEDDDEDEDEDEEEGGGGEVRRGRGGRGIEQDQNNSNDEEKGDRNKIKSSFDTNEDYPTDNTNVHMNQGCRCTLIWSGTVKKKNFLNWKMIIAKTELEITDYLQKHDALHYYHIVRKQRNVLGDV